MKLQEFYKYLFSLTGIPQIIYCIVIYFIKIFERIRDTFTKLNHPSLSKF